MSSKLKSTSHVELCANSSGIHHSELGASLAVDSCFNPTFKSGTLCDAHLISRIWIHPRSACSATISAESRTTTGSKEFRPEETFSRIECGDSRTACVPKFCQSQVQRWEAVVHCHLKRDKVIPSTHPQANEIKHNPNGCEALTLLICPCHPGFAENGILIKPHPQQGKRLLEDHFHRCEFCCCGQECNLGAVTIGTTPLT